MTRLYVVDDDWGFLELVQEVAAPLGFDTVVAAAPKDFKSLCGCEADAVVMIDMVMPETDGIELVSWLSEQGFAGKLIFVSGFAEQYAEMASALAVASGLNVADTLAKPVKLDRLRKALVAAKNPASSRG